MDIKQLRQFILTTPDIIRDTKTEYRLLSGTDLSLSESELRNLVSALLFATDNNVTQGSLQIEQITVVEPKNENFVKIRVYCDFKPHGQPRFSKEALLELNKEEPRKSRIEFEGTDFNSVSDAADSARILAGVDKPRTNGWTFWKLIDKQGKRTEFDIDLLRKALKEKKLETLKPYII